MSTPLRIVQPTVHLADPHDCTDGADMLSILTALFDTLVRREGRCHVPHLAESWDISADCRTFDLCLRGGVTFADGTSVDAEAVCTNLRRMARPDKGYTLGSPGAWHQYLGGAEIRPTGMLTLRIDLAAPVADLLDVLCQAFVAAPACLDAL
ncbi:MAG: ABC transporter substrate-binding protein, partial [Pseudomonadota bacterium]